MTPEKSTSGPNAYRIPANGRIVANQNSLNKPIKIEEDAPGFQSPRLPRKYLEAVSKLHCRRRRRCLRYSEDPDFPATHPTLQRTSEAASEVLKQLLFIPTPFCAKTRPHSPPPSHDPSSPSNQPSPTP